MKKCFFAFILLMSMLSALAQETSEMQQVMEKMPGLVKLVNNLQTAAQSSEDKAKYELAIEDLRGANKSMMNWMVGFGERFDADEMMKGKELTAQKKEWLQEEKIKVIALEEEIDGSLKKAAAALLEE